MGYADLHVHSNFSYDGTAPIERILRTTANETQLSILAITDHDEISGALLAEKLAPKFGLHVIVGSEVTTAEGHLLSLFLRERVPAGRSLLETLSLVDQQGGVCIVPHPEARFTHSISLKSITQALDTVLGQKVLLGIEVFNAGIFRSDSNSKAMDFALNHDISITANSDAHSCRMIGLAATGFHGTSPDELRHSLETRQTYIQRSFPITNSIIALSWLHDKLVSGKVLDSKQTTPVSA